ncbi:MAG: sulfotransferase family 2 domain-containing protein [Cyanobacteria bacterium J06627_8]
MSSSQENTILFLHLMKTGGRTLASILKQNFANDTRFHCGQRPGETIGDLSQLSDDKRRSLRLIHGHFRFGIHHQLPQPFTYITLLRDPIERVISHYYYALHTPKHYTHQLVVENQMPLSAYVEHGIIDLNNGQVRAIAGDVSQSFKFGEQNNSLLYEAQANLDAYFSLVGITERFDESLLLLKRQFNLTRVLYTRANVNSSRRAQTPISDDDIECIKHYNSLDIQLYERAKQQLQHQIEQAGASFQTELKLLKELNTQYEGVQTHLNTVKHQLSKVRTVLRQARRKRNRMKTALQHQEAEYFEQLNSPSGKLWQLWDDLKQNLFISHRINGD